MYKILFYDGDEPSCVRCMECLGVVGRGGRSGPDGRVCDDCGRRCPVGAYVVDIPDGVLWVVDDGKP